MDRSQVALQVISLGLGVTLTSLFLLYLVLNVFGRLFVTKKNSPLKSGDAGIRVDKAISEVTASPLAEDHQKALIAAIVGSLSMYLFDKPPVRPFAVSIAPSLKTGNSWVMFGRKELMTGAHKLAMLRRKSKP